MDSKDQNPDESFSHEDKRTDKIISDLLAFLKSQREKNKGSQPSSGDEIISETELELKTADDEVFFEINQDYFEEYNEFRKFLQHNIQASFGVKINNPKLSFKKFKELMDTYGSRQEIEKNFQIQFQPRVIVVKNGNVLENGDSVGKTNSNDQTTKAIGVVDEEVFIYPNDLTFA